MHWLLPGIRKEPSLGAAVLCGLTVPGELPAKTSLA